MEMGLPLARRDWEIWDHETRALNLKQLLVNVISLEAILILDPQTICGPDFSSRGSVVAHPVSLTSL